MVCLAEPETSVRVVAAERHRGSTWTDSWDSWSVAEDPVSAADLPGTGCRCGLGVGDSWAAWAEERCWVEADPPAPVYVAVMAAEGLQARHCRVDGTASPGLQSSSVAVEGWLVTAPARIQAASGFAAAKVLA